MCRYHAGLSHRFLRRPWLQLPGAASSRVKQLGKTSRSGTSPLSTPRIRSELQKQATAASPPSLSGPHNPQPSLAREVERANSTLHSVRRKASARLRFSTPLGEAIIRPFSTPTSLKWRGVSRTGPVPPTFLFRIFHGPASGDARALSHLSRLLFEVNLTKETRLLRINCRGCEAQQDFDGENAKSPPRSLHGAHCRRHRIPTPIRGPSIPSVRSVLMFDGIRVGRVAVYPRLRGGRGGAHRPTLRSRRRWRALLLFGAAGSIIMRWCATCRCRRRGCVVPEEDGAARRGLRGSACTAAYLG